ncbi:MAG: 3-hydroxyacyl-CoA dehydrogenase NAD-binding domain-containing protein [Acidobacteriota bacterium]
MSPERSGTAGEVGGRTLPLEGPGVLFETRRDGLAFLIFDRPGAKVNTIDAPIVAVLEILLDRAAHDKDVRGMVVTSAKPGSFIAGADVREIQALGSAQQAESASRKGQRLFDSIERLPFPVVAAISGTCLGGGTELALACHFRVAADDPRTEIGLPEVRLGILPAWGGTQRLPRRVGLSAALDMILTGKTLDARRALRAGLVDAVAPPEYLLEAAERMVREAADGKRAPRRRMGDGSLARLNPIRRARLAVAARLARRRLGRRLNEAHYPAPFRALETVIHGLKHGTESGLRREMENVGQLAVGPTSKNLVALFFLQQAARKEGGAGAAAAPRKVGAVTVVGAGTMGGGIAQALSRAGIAVRLKDIEIGALARGMRAAHELSAAELRKGRIQRREFDQRMALIRPTLDYSGVRRCDVVLEAVVESIDVKRKVLQEIEAAIPEGTIFATNTSSLPIAEIASSARRPQDVVGMHFFNPVHRMPLVEVIRGPRTSDEAVATVAALARRIGKSSVVVSDSPGFLVNRILTTYLGEALVMLEDGARIEEVDRTMVDFGMPMGPFAVLDRVGIDVAAHVAAVLTEAFRERVPRSPALQILREKGWLGRKSGRGFYVYRHGRRGGGEPAAREVNAGVYSLVSARERMSLDPAPTESRLVLPMINEAARCLESGIVASPAEVDLAMVLGVGFPPFRGGLLRHADALGAAAVVQGLEVLAERHGTRFMATRMLMEMAGERRRFYGD